MAPEQHSSFNRTEEGRTTDARKAALTLKMQCCYFGPYRW